MKKIVIKLELRDEKANKKKVMEGAVSIITAISGDSSVTMDMKTMTITVIGDVDADHAVEITSKLSKICHVKLLTVGEDKNWDEKKESIEKWVKIICKCAGLVIQMIVQLDEEELDD